MGNEQGRLQGVPTPAGIQSMDESLQKKFAKGIQYNMKIVIRGDRNTGKTTLFHRMEGKPFNEAYLPTNEIQVTSILWSYRVTNDTVKVEIWDVVDKGRAQKSRGSKGLLKMFNSPDVGEEEGEGEGQKTLDASFLDVYKGAHGVVFTFDVTKPWTWKYIERELPQVPLHIPVIILANFMDLHEHRLVSKEECTVGISTMDRPDGAADIRYAECSMKNGFGLMHLHKFLSIPFLQLQQETLLQQLQVNREQTLAAMEELDSAKFNEDQNYSKYLAKIQRMAEEKRLKARQQSQEEGGEEAIASPIRRDTMESKTSSQSDTPPRTHPGVSSTPPPSRQNSKGQIPRSSGSITSKFSSKFAGFRKGKEEAKKELKVEAPPPTTKPKEVSTNHISEFVPEGSTDFLEDDDDEEGGYLEEGESEEDSDDDSGGNPLIAADEDLSSPEESDSAPPPLPPQPAVRDTATSRIHPAAANLAGAVEESAESSEEEEEEEEEEQHPPPPAILIPVQASPVIAKKSPPKQQRSPPKQKRTPKPLKSALDVELTESEEEEEEEEKDDSDVDVSKSLKKKQSIFKSHANGQKLEEIFEPSPPLPDKNKHSGLMLQFSTSPAPAKVPKDVSSRDKSHAPTGESPDQKKREKRKKKSKKSRHSKDEADGVGVLIGVDEGSKSTPADPVGVVGGGATGDPYGAIASLDAWLNSDSTTVDDFLGPTKLPGTVATAGVEVGTEEGGPGDEPAEEKQPRKSTKKHKKKRSEGATEGDREHRKKKHKSSRHKSLEQPEGGGDYQFI